MTILVKILHWLCITCRIKSKPSTHYTRFSVIWLLLFAMGPWVVDFVPLTVLTGEWHAPRCTLSRRAWQPLFILQLIWLRWFLLSETLPEVCLLFLPSPNSPVVSDLTLCFYNNQKKKKKLYIGNNIMELSPYVPVYLGKIASCGYHQLVAQHAALSKDFWNQAMS